MMVDEVVGHVDSLFVHPSSCILEERTRRVHPPTPAGQERMNWEKVEEARDKVIWPEEGFQNGQKNQ